MRNRDPNSQCILLGHNPSWGKEVNSIGRTPSSSMRRAATFATNQEGGPTPHTFCEYHLVAMELAPLEWFDSWTRPGETNVNPVPCSDLSRRSPSTATAGCGQCARDPKRDGGNGAPIRSAGRERRDVPGRDGFREALLTGRIASAGSVGLAMWK